MATGSTRTTAGCRSAEYAAAWIEERPDLRPKTIQPLQVPAQHATWHRPSAPRPSPKSRKATSAAGARACSTLEVSAVTAAKAYRLLKAIMNTAVDDGLIRRNPCRIKGAGQEKSPERAALTIAAGLRARRCDRPALPGAGAAGDVRQPALGRAGRAAPQRHRPGGLHRPGRTAAHRDEGRRTRRSGRPSRTPGVRTVPFPEHDRGRPALAPGLLRPGRRRRAGVHQPGRNAAAAQQLLPPRLAAGGSRRPA